MGREATQETIAQLWQRAQAAALAGHRSEAQRLFEAILAQDPTHEGALLWMAYLAGGGRRSLAYIARLLEAHPHSARGRAALRWARAQEARGEATPPGEAYLPSSGEESTGRGGRRGLFLTALTIWLVAVVLLLLIGADGLLAEAIPAPSETPTAVRLAYRSRPTATPPLLPTLTPSPTATPSPTPTSTPTPTPTPTNTLVPTVTPAPTRPPVGSRWIEVNLTTQTLIAHEGNRPVRWIKVSTGLPQYPTVTGVYRIYVKYRSADMSGPGYYLPDVPYVMYFYKGYGLHGTYWHNNFGRPMSHGCVNLPVEEAKWLYEWADVGTVVNIHY